MKFCGITGENWCETEPIFFTQMTANTEATLEAGNATDGPAA